MFSYQTCRSNMRFILLGCEFRSHIQTRMFSIFTYSVKNVLICNLNVWTFYATNACMSTVHFRCKGREVENLLLESPSFWISMSNKNTSLFNYFLKMLQRWNVHRDCYQLFSWGMVTPPTCTRESETPLWLKARKPVYQ